MKRLLTGLSLFTVACAAPPSTGPSTTRETATQATPPAAAPADPGAESATVDPAPGNPGANAPAPVFSIAGPRDCVTAATGAMQWVLGVTDAGPRALRLVALTQQDDSPGCAPTTRNARTRIGIQGVTDYTPHSSGQTIFTFDPKMYSCGRVQVDVSIFDTAGTELLIVGMVVDYGSVCTPPPPSPSPRLACSPPTITAPLPSTAIPHVPGPILHFEATGGIGDYAWSTSDTPDSIYFGPFFSGYFETVGIHTVTVRSGTEAATCQVTVVPNPPVPGPQP